jgi:hypothetical protein
VKDHAWPPRSPDLNALDFYYLWYHIKSLDCEETTANRDALLQLEQWMLQIKHGTLRASSATSNAV